MNALHRGARHGARTRLKRRDPEGERLHDAHVPDESDSDEHENDA